MKDFITGLSKWPLLLAAVLAYALAIYEETVTDNTEVLIGIAGMVVGSVLLGTWLALFVIDFERRWRIKHREDDPLGDPPTEAPDTPIPPGPRLDGPRGVSSTSTKKTRG